MRSIGVVVAVGLVACAAHAEEIVPVIGTDELAARTAGAQDRWTITLIDVRSRVEYEEAHLPGAIHVPAAQAAALLPRLVQDKDRDLVFYCNGSLCPKSARAALAARAVGYRHVFNYNEGMPGWARTNHPVMGTPLPQVDVPAVLPEDLQAALRAGRKPTLLDLREPSEYKVFHLVGAINIPLDDLEKRAGELPKTGDIVLACHAGQQSLIGGRLLNKLGRGQVKRLDGGIVGWQQKGLPLESQAAVAHQQ